HIETKRNFTTEWISVTNVDTNNTDELQYNLVNLSTGFHYYRITSIDRMGYTNPDMENEFLEIFIETEIVNEVIGEDNTENEIYAYVGGAVVLISIALFSANYLFRKNGTDTVANDGPVLVPLETFEQEGDYEKMGEASDGEEYKDPFSVISGSEFSRQVSFVCESGCLKVFKGKGDDKEIMCPHCGSIGESPL
ncbi:MAG: hypothetical protein P8R34_03110, partial [archaeon]|nr:hypothetical protein [archaeon]